MSIKDNSFNKEKLEILLETAEEIVHTYVAIMDHDGKVVLSITKPDSKYSDLLKVIPKEYKENMDKLLTTLKDKADIFQSSLGFNCFVVPLNQIKKGFFLFVGPIIASDNNFSAFIKNHPQKNNLLPLTAKLPQYTSEEILKKFNLVLKFTNNLMNSSGNSPKMSKQLKDVTDKLNEKFINLDILSDLLESLYTIDKIHSCSIGLLNESGDYLLDYLSTGVIERIPFKIPKGLGLGWWVLREQKPTFITHAHSDPRLDKKMINELVQSIGAWPLLNNGKKIGVLYIYGDNHEELSCEEFDFVTTMANIISFTIDRYNNYQIESHRIRGIKAIREISRVVNIETDLKKILGSIINMVIDLTEVDACYIYIINGLGKPELKIARGLDRDKLKDLYEDQNKISSKEDQFIDVPIRSQNKLLGYITLRAEKLSISEELRDLIETIANLAGVAIENNNYIARIKKKQFDFINLIVQTLVVKDPRFKGHLEEVSIYSKKIGLELKLSEEELYNIECAALLHNFGLILLPEDFAKDEKYNFTNYSREVLYKGIQFLNKTIALTSVLPIMNCILEEYDGNGFPNGLKGSQIPLGARIISIVMEFDYLQRFAGIKTPIEALNKIKNRSGTKFDPDLVLIFERLVRLKQSITLDNFNQNVDEKIVLETNKFLTPREEEILSLVAKGQNNREIAQKLTLSEKTVKTHITNILRKLDVTDRTKAAVFAIEQKQALRQDVVN